MSTAAHPSDADGASATEPVVDRDELIAITQRLVRCPGTNPPGHEEAPANELIAVARELGLQVELTQVAPGRPNLAVTLPATASDAQSPGMLLLGHSDVVTLG